MRLNFTKMHGLGNDFIVIDAVHQTVCLQAEQIHQMADRHFGVGCDQLLLVEPADNPAQDFRYRIFNADGSEAGQCGNGARCLARFVRDAGLSQKNEIRVETSGGPLLLRFESDSHITVNMGVPRHAPSQIPLQAETESLDYTASIENTEWRFGAVSVGNPHAVIRVPAIEQAPVATIGAALESHPIFPERANIGFMQVLDRTTVRLRVFERGAAETLACGSGACAAAVVGIEHGWLDQGVTVHLPGGQLVIAWRGRGEPVYMTGPAISVFEGVIEL